MTNKKKIAKIKYNAYLLKSRYQLPSVLYNEIIKIDEDTDVNFINKLMDLSKDYLRVEGYYRNNNKHDTANSELLKILTK